MEVWNPILANLCTLHELRTVYTLDDLSDFNAALTLQSELTRYASDKNNE